MPSFNVRFSGKNVTWVVTPQSEQPAIIVQVIVLWETILKSLDEARGMMDDNPARENILNDVEININAMHDILSIFSGIEACEAQREAVTRIFASQVEKLLQELRTSVPI